MFKNSVYSSVYDTVVKRQSVSHHRFHFHVHFFGYKEGLDGKSGDVEAPKLTKERVGRAALTSPSQGWAQGLLAQADCVELLAGAATLDARAVVGFSHPHHAGSAALSSSHP